MAAAAIKKNDMDVVGVIFFSLFLDIDWQNLQLRGPANNWWLFLLNECRFRPPLCTYMANWARRTSWGWWDELNDPALQTHDSTFEPCRSQAEHATSWSRRFSLILNYYEWAGNKHFVSLKLKGQSEVRTRDLLLSKQPALSTAPVPPPFYDIDRVINRFFGNGGANLYAKFSETHQITLKIVLLSFLTHNIIAV